MTMLGGRLLVILSLAALAWAVIIGMTGILWFLP
jgi:hypothetical protein